MLTLVSLNVGQAQTQPGAKPWRSAIWKQPVLVPLELGIEGLAGDQQTNRRVHGGPDKAICVDSVDHIAWWREELETDERGPGAVGENFTVTGQTEADVCLGDVYEVGDALVEVSQPEGRRARRWRGAGPGRTCRSASDAAAAAGGTCVSGAPGRWRPALRWCCRSGRIPSGRFSA